MIVLNIITKNVSEIEAIMKEIIINRFAQSVQLDHEVKHILIGEKLNEVKTPKISFITKALLYNEIETFLHHKFPTTDFMIYSIPITQMNREHSSKLREFLKTI
jgi:hypothetical protein